MFFAGEHTSIDYQGYLNEAVESGERAAQEVMDDLYDLLETLYFVIKNCILQFSHS
ncbi:FAD-dependent oxidoreductase [Ureibacillus sp. NPDC094379]